jgi:hypothetical protein
MIPTRITIHCTDTKNNQHVSIEAITADHIARGFGGIGYHAVIQPNGEVCRGRPLNQAGAHVAGENTGNLGIALAGSDRFTARQFEALRSEIDSFRQLYPIRPYSIFCHYQFKSAEKQGKTCPNIEINRLLGWYLSHYEDAIAQYLVENDKRYVLPH